MKIEPLIPEAIQDKRIDGKAIAGFVRRRCSEELNTLQEEGLQLKLVVIRVGDDPASKIYVRHKVRACAQVGLQSEVVELPSEICQKELIEEIHRLNADPEVDGILVQLPLPEHFTTNEVLSAVDPHKDVDGFHPVNLGQLFSRSAALQPCTPSGILFLLHVLGVELRGKNAVVVGRSVIVGRPMAMLLLRENCTVTMCHRHTADLAAHVAQADILVVAAGVPELVKGAWIKPGAVVIDVGINRDADQRLVGDVEYNAALEHVSAITPVPGGVGPMTVAMLLWNTILAGRLRRQGREDVVAPILHSFTPTHS